MTRRIEHPLLMKLTMYTLALTAFVAVHEARAQSNSTTQPATAPSAAVITTPHATSDDRALAALNLDDPNLQSIKEAGGDLDAIKQAYLAYRRTRSSVKWFVSPDEMPAQPSEASDTIGDEICHHFIRSSYGFKPDSGSMGDDFNWKANPLPRSSPDFTDEWTWCVVSRTGFWKQLADTYWKTHDEKYAQAWAGQLQDFVHKNPPGQAKDFPSLWRTLDASERMYDSWPYCYFHFINSPSFTADAHWTYLKSVIDHANLLKSGLAAKGRTGNWVVSECWGLYAIGVLFPELREAASWRELAMDRFVVELNSCVPPDGFEAELSPGYHYFTLSSFTGPMKAANLNHLPIPDAFREKVRAMYRAPVWVMDQRGLDVATNDSGICNAAVEARQGLQLLGSDPLLEWAASGGARGEAPPASTMLPYAGFYAMRSGWKLDDTFLFFRAGPTGIMHLHQDMLEVTLNAWNKNLLIEQGNYSYDQSEWRRYVVGTSSHSTMIVDGNGQNRAANRAPVTQPVTNPWVTTPLFDFAAGTYDGGYQQSVYDANTSGHPTKFTGPVDRSITHTRRVVFIKPYYALVLDTADGSGKHTFDTLFQMDSPSAEIAAKSQAVFSQNQGQVQLGLYPVERSNLQINIVQGQKDPMLGWFANQHRPISTVRFRKEQDAPARFATFLFPYKNEHPVFVPQLLASTPDAWSCSFHSFVEEGLLAISLKNVTSPLSAQAGKDAFKAVAEGVLLRHRNGENPWAGAWGLTSFETTDCSFTLDHPATLVWQSNGDSVLFFNGGDECKVALISPVTANAVLPPGRWTRVAAKETTVTQASPLPFPPMKWKQMKPDYKEYLSSIAPIATAGDSASVIELKIADLIIPHGAVRARKMGSEQDVVAKWDELGSQLTAQADIPQDGWYHISVRYCSGASPRRTLLINDKCPFAEAREFAIPCSTGQSSDSDGWSNRTNDWREFVLGESDIAGGWKIHLTKGPATIALENNGDGLNIDWIKLVPADAGSK